LIQLTKPINDQQYDEASSGIQYSASWQVLVVGQIAEAAAVRTVPAGKRLPTVPWCVGHEIVLALLKQRKQPKPKPSLLNYFSKTNVKQLVGEALYTL
jgi:hypothetical protein